MDLEQNLHNINTSSKSAKNNLFFFTLFWVRIMQSATAVIYIILAAVINSTWGCGPGWSGASGGWCCGSSAASWRAAGNFEETRAANPWVKPLEILPWNPLRSWTWAESREAGTAFVPGGSHRLQIVLPRSSRSTGRSWWIDRWSVVKRSLPLCSLSLWKMLSSGLFKDFCVTWHMRRVRIWSCSSLLQNSLRDLKNKNLFLKSKMD